MLLLIDDLPSVCRVKSELSSTAKKNVSGEMILFKVLVKFILVLFRNGNRYAFTSLKANSLNYLPLLQLQRLLQLEWKINFKRNYF